MFSKPTNWKDMVQIDNQCLCSIFFIDNLHTASLLINTVILDLNNSIMLKSCCNLFFHNDASSNKRL